MKSDCQNCEQKEACVPFFEHEGAMEHLKTAHKTTAIVAIAYAVALVIIVIAFVTGYTSRTDKWLSTYAALQNRSVVTNGVYEQPSP